MGKNQKRKHKYRTYVIGEQKIERVEVEERERGKPTKRKRKDFRTFYFAAVSPSVISEFQIKTNVSLYTNFK